MKMVYVTSISDLPVTFDGHLLPAKNNRVGPIVLTGTIKSLARQGLVTFTERNIIGTEDVFVAPKVVSAASYTLTKEDAGLTIEFTNACVITLPASLPAGFACACTQMGTGEVSFVAGSGAAFLQLDSGTKIAGRYGEVGVRVSSNNDTRTAAQYIGSGAFI